MRYHFFFIKIPSFANIYNSVHDRNSGPYLHEHPNRGLLVQTANTNAVYLELPRRY